MPNFFLNLTFILSVIINIYIKLHLLGSGPFYHSWIFWSVHVLLYQKIHCVPSANPSGLMPPVRSSSEEDLIVRLGQSGPIQPFCTYELYFRFNSVSVLTIINSNVTSQFLHFEIKWRTILFHCTNPFEIWKSSWFLMQLAWVIDRCQVPYLQYEMLKLSVLQVGFTHKHLFLLFLNYNFKNIDIANV